MFKVRTDHIGFSDYMVVLPKRWRKITARLTTCKADDLIIGFLGKHFEQISSKFVIREPGIETVEEKGKTTTRLVAEPGDLIVHWIFVS